jgi:integrase/recombinase XerD
MHHQTWGVCLLLPRRVRLLRLHGDRESPQCRDMLNLTGLASVLPDPPAPFTGRLRLVVAACLARFTGISRNRTGSGLRCYLSWCAGHGLDPLAAQRPHLELYIRPVREIRRFRPSAVSRGFPVTAGFYRACVLDSVWEHSPAGHVRGPRVPAGSPTLGSRTCSPGPCSPRPGEPGNPYGFALPAMPGLRIFEAAGADTAGLGD